MAVFKAFSPDVEVLGEVVLGVVDGLGTFRSGALKILADCGIPDPQPDQWYPQQAWLDAFKIISARLGSYAVMRIGFSVFEARAAAYRAVGADTVEQVFLACDRGYRLCHRAGEAGGYRFEQTGTRAGRLTVSSPYPCDFHLGTFRAACELFAPPDSAGGRVIHDDTQPCRSKGADTCTYLVEW